MAHIYEAMQGWNELAVCVRLVLAFICGMVLGIRPEYKQIPAGLKTHVLVCLGATTATMTGFYVYYFMGAKPGIDPLRIGAQVISGIGFLGIGTIVMIGRSKITGLTTAAGLWNCAAVGIALGSGFYLGGILATILALIAITILQQLETKKIQKYAKVDVYLEITDLSKVNQVVAKLQEPQYCITNLRVRPARSEKKSNLGVEATITIVKESQKQQCLDQIAAVEEVAFAIESV